MLFKVKQQYARGGSTVIAEFDRASDAELFIQAKRDEDARLKVKVVYQLLEGLEVVKEWSETEEKNSRASGGSSAGASQTSSFQPTPFNVAPRPSGMPHNWVKDESNEGKK